eukprot:COSAG04_NODE_970_length_9101_cov_663.450900_3_plen_60_part_00
MTALRCFAHSFVCSMMPTRFFFSAAFRAALATATQAVSSKRQRCRTDAHKHRRKFAGSR